MGKQGRRGMERELQKHVLGIFVFMAFLIVLYLCVPYIQKTGFDIANLTNSTENQSFGVNDNQSVSTNGNTATVTVNTDQNIGVINPNFYGANTHGLWLGAGTPVDINNDGIVGTASNLTWNQQAWLDSDMTYIRWDAFLERYYTEGNATSGSFVFTGNLTNRVSQLDWAHQNKIRVLLILDYMPTWLADNSSGYCSNLKFCPPSNYTIWQNIVADYLNRLTVNGTYASDIDVEVWNEPDLSFWLGNLPTDDPTKSVYYNTFYNSTYKAVKLEYPNIEVGGPATSWIGRAFVNRFLSNFSNEIDFISFHEYADTVYITLSSDLNQALTSCHQYNANCSRIILSEWNTYSSFIKNVSSNISQYGSNIALGYTNMLDNYPSNVSMLLYQWSEQYKYSNTQYYPEYPQLWSMVSEPQLDNAYYPPYNVTSDFAHYHSARDIVVSSSSNNGNIFVVASKNSTGQVDITVISNSTSNVSVTIGLSGALIGNFNALEDLRTGTTYSISGGSVNMGALQQYDVKHYETVNVSNISQNNNNQNSNSNSESSGSSGGGGGGITTTTSSNESNTNFIPTNDNADIGNDNINGGGSAENISLTVNSSSEENGQLSNPVTVNISNWVLAITALIVGITVLFIAIIYFLIRKKHAPVHLIDWIKKGREMGHEDHHLKRMLIKNGWDEETVDKAMSHPESKKGESELV